MDPPPIRAGVWLFCGVVLGVLGLLVYATVSGEGSEPPRAEEVAADERAARAVARRPAVRRWFTEPRTSVAESAPQADADLAESLRRTDPQLFVSRRSFPDGGVQQPAFGPMTRVGRLELYQGTEDLRSDAACDVRVLPVRTRRFNCLVRVMCDGVVVYPNPAQTAGYVPCDLEGGLPVRARDDGTTEQDGDPTLDIDLGIGQVEVTDEREDGVSVRARISLPPLPRIRVGTPGGPA